MGWERRGDRLYLYRSVRIDGRPVKQYLAADDARGRAVAAELRRVRHREAQSRETLKAHRAAARRRAEDLMAALAGADAALRAASDGVLYAAGYRKHHRSEWRLNRELRVLTKRLEVIQARVGQPKPAVLIDAPSGDAEAADLFTKARAGDATAQGRIRGLIADRGWVGRIGDLAERATEQLIRRAAGADPVSATAIGMQAGEMLRALTGPNPPLVEALLARRVVNAWVAVHALEVDLAVREPADRRTREMLDRMISRAQRRMSDAVRELARVRRLALPEVFPRIAVVTPPPPPELPPALAPASAGYY